MAQLGVVFTDLSALAFHQDVDGDGEREGVELPDHLADLQGHGQVPHHPGHQRLVDKFSGTTQGASFTCCRSTVK